MTTHLYIKTETSGLPLWKLPSEDPAQPWIVKLACELVADGETLQFIDQFILPTEIDPGFVMPAETTAINKITLDLLRSEGSSPKLAFDALLDLACQADAIVGFNVDFDLRMLRIFGAKVTGSPWDCKLDKIDVMKLAREVCRIPKPNAGRPDMFKNPTLVEAYELLIGETKPEPNVGRSTIAQIKAVHGKVGGLAL